MSRALDNRPFDDRPSGDHPPDNRPLDPGQAESFRADRMLDVLIPTRNRPAELAVTLSGLAAHDSPAAVTPGSTSGTAGDSHLASWGGARPGSAYDFGVVVSDQSDGEPAWSHPSVATMVRVLRHRGHPVLLTRRLPRRGLAEHRAYLLDQTAARYVLYLDDDVWLEPGTINRLMLAMEELGCGFVGNAVHGLSYSDDVRPEAHRHYEEWDVPPRPERISPNTTEWQRATVHSAANLLHITRDLRLAPGEWRAYKVSWIGGCVLYDRARLRAVGGFGFWRSLPREHQGEDVAAQLAVLERYGGAGILPSGAYHLEAPTTVVERNVEAWEVILTAQAGYRRADTDDETSSAASRTSATGTSPTKDTRCGHSPSPGRAG